MKNIRLLCSFFVLLCGFNSIILPMIITYSQKEIRRKWEYYKEMRKKYPYINARASVEVKEQPTGTMDIKSIIKTYPVPVDKTTMESLNLCPLFVQKKEVELDSKLVEEMKAEMRQQKISEKDIESQLSSLTVGSGPQYHVFTGVGFEGRQVSADVPCVVSLGALGSVQRTLIQLKSLDQFELAQQTGLSPALCAGHALNNSRLVRNYALTNSIAYLQKIQDISDAASFLTDLKIDDWVNVEIVRKNIALVSAVLGADGVDISAVSTVALFDSGLIQKEEFAIFDSQEFEYAQLVKKSIQEGLKQEHYVHMMVVGNEEATLSHGHYFAFAIIKVKDQVQYVVLDTLPDVYHLQEGSHEKDRLMFIIDNIEKGDSSVKIANIRLQAGFLKGEGVVSETSKLEIELANERMEEIGDFTLQITSLNKFSKQLNQYGIQKYLSKESRENLTNYLNLINEIAEMWGQDYVYPTMRSLIKKELTTKK